MSLEAGAGSRATGGSENLSGPLGRRVLELRAELKAIARRHGFSTPRIFGSVARGEEQACSDIDLLVDPPADGVGLLGLARFQRDVEELLGARVEVVLRSELRSTVADRVRGDVIVL